MSGTTGKVLAVAVPDLEMNRVFRITYGYEGGETMYSSYYEGLDVFDYLSDLPLSYAGKCTDRQGCQWFYAPNHHAKI